jgi:hypothetical protein
LSRRRTSSSAPIDGMDKESLVEARRAALLGVCLLSLTLGAACRNNHQEPASQTSDSRVAAFDVQVTAFPPDAEFRFEMPGSNLTTTAPAQLTLKEKPERILASRKGYSGAALAGITNPVLHIELVPDEAQADRLLADADTIDRLLDYLVLYPMLVKRSFYDKLAVLMAEGAAATEINKVRDVSGVDLLRDGPAIIRLSEKPPTGYALSFSSAVEPRQAVFARHPTRLLHLIHRIDGSTIRFSETSLSYLALSSCDCFLFQVTIGFRVHGTRITFEDITYERPDKGNPPGLPMSLKKRIETDGPPSDSNK